MMAEGPVGKDAPSPAVIRLPPWLEQGAPFSETLDMPSVAAPDPRDRERAERAIAAIVGEGLGGSWWGRRWQPASDRRGYDALVTAGTGAADDRLLAAFEAVGQSHPPERLLVLAPKPGPGGAGLERLLAGWRDRGATVLDGEVDAWPLLAAVPLVHALGDEVGFLALLAGKRVVCHLPCFYGGWGLTADRPGVLARSRRLDLPGLFAVHALAGSRYRSPYDGQECRLEEALEVVRLCRRQDAINRGIAVCLGMAFWKRRRIAHFLRSAKGFPSFLGDDAGAGGAAVAAARARGGAVAVWASREPPGLASLAAAAGVPVYRVEDGFIRSAGLGADFIPPASITLDAAGLHYDPSRPSELERILERIAPDGAAVERTRRLIALLVSRKITKYASTGAVRRDLPPGRVILVPGQVEDDASVRLGNAGVRGNLDLLCRVRAANPDARILYKPHPDVDSGYRLGAVADRLILEQADRIVRGGAMAELISLADEVHCLTSLAGFEALLRGKPVTVYGQPFYAGWGLTTDINPPPRRGRRLTLEQLVAGTLLAYPRYIDPRTGIPCGPEVLIARLADPSLWRPTWLVRLRRVQGRLWRLFRRPASTASAG